jgi:hypothetical protein
MARRKKYDTEALVGQLKSERRTGMLMTFAGVAILVGLGVLYFTGVDSEEIAEVPKDAEAAAPAAPKPEEKVAGVGAPEAPKETPKPPEEPPKPGILNLNLPKKPIAVWVDDEKLPAKPPKKKLELAPGKHTIKTKFGKKTVQEEIEVAAGGTYTLTVDPKKKKLTLK